MSSMLPPRRWARETHLATVLSVEGVRDSTVTFRGSGGDEEGMTKAKNLLLSLVPGFLLSTGSFQEVKHAPF